jgi:Rha family phage regulatory protein
MKNLDFRQTMTSREIAELSGKQHKHVMDAIRTMEGSWAKVSGSKFRLAEYTDEQGKTRPMYQLTKTECLYIATKFNDEARARLVIRWEELETKEVSVANAKIQQAQASAKRRNEIALRVREIDDSINRMMSERKALVKERGIIDNQDYAVLSFPLFPEYSHPQLGGFPNSSSQH